MYFDSNRDIIEYRCRLLYGTGKLKTEFLTVNFRKIDSKWYWRPDSQKYRTNEWIGGFRTQKDCQKDASMKLRSRAVIT